MAAKRDCIKAIQASAKEGLITEAEAKQIIAAVRRAGQERARKKAISLDTAMKEIAGEMALKEKTDAAIDKRQMLMDLSTRRRAKDFSKQFKLWGKGLAADLFGSESTATKGAGYGADQQIEALYGRYASRLFAELQEAGVWDDFSKGRFAKEFYIESYQLDTPNGKPGITKSKSAQAIARIYRDLQDELNAVVNARGAYRTDAPGWIITQTHSREALQAAGDGDMKNGYDVWRAFIIDKIDAERTFNGADPELWLRGFHQNSYTGRHGELFPDEKSRPKTFGSVGKRLSGQRVLWFKGPEEAFLYNEAFGVRDYNNAILENIKRDTRSAVLMERYGPNAKANLQRVVQELSEEAKKRPDSKQQLAALEPSRFLSRYEVLSGETNISTRPTVSRFTDIIRAFRIMSSGGKMLFSAFGDRPFMGSEMAYQGIGALDRIGAHLSTFSREQATKVMLSQGVVPHLFGGHVAARWGFEARTDYKVNDYLHKFFSLNFMNAWTDINKGVMADATASNIANHSKLPMENLPVEMGRLLQHYGITGKEWDAMRGTTYKMDEEPLEGFSFITPDKFDAIADDVLDGIVAERGLSATTANRNRIRQSLKDKYGAVIVDRVHHGVPEPGAKERFMTTWGGAHRGTFVGETAALVMIFKSFPITAVSKVLGRNLYGFGHTAAQNWADNPWHGGFNIATLIATTAIAGYIGNSMRDLTQGRTPKRLVEDNGDVNWDVFFSAIQRGGGLGIYGDFLFTEYDRSYRSALNTLSGPVLGQLDPLLAMGSKAVGLAGGKEGVKAESLAYDAEKFVEGNIPFASLFYVKPVLDYFIFWNLKEMASPGVLRRTERAVRDKSHQDFFVVPSEDRFEF